MGNCQIDTARQDFRRRPGPAFACGQAPDRTDDDGMSQRNGGAPLGYEARQAKVSGPAIRRPR
jgi:hypothetical protein